VGHIFAREETLNTFIVSIQTPMANLEEKHRILETARERFFRDGITKVTLDEIADQLGMSKKTLYKFFPSKEELLKSVVHFMMGFIERRLGAIVSSDKPVEQKMTEVLALVGGFASRIGVQFQRDMQRFAPTLWGEIENFRREHLFTKLEKLFLQAKQEGILRSDLNQELFMLVFFHAMHGIMNPQTLSQHAFSPDMAFKEIFRILLEGAFTDEARARLHLFEPSFRQQL
jgi:AcrR family transcriptional regulator